MEGKFPTKVVGAPLKLFHAYQSSTILKFQPAKSDVSQTVRGQHTKLDRSQKPALPLVSAVGVHRKAHRKANITIISIKKLFDDLLASPIPRNLVKQKFTFDELQELATTASSVSLQALSSCATCR